MSNKSDKQQKIEGRLRLRNIGKSESTLSKWSNNASDDKQSDIEELNSSGTDDSLVDFKSPKQNLKLLQKNSVKIVKNASKKNTTSKKREESNSRQNQQSIATLFAKAQAEETTFVCPLCLRAFSEADIQTMHMKNCAAKNNVSTKKLLAAVELHERQVRERKAIGLPGKAIQMSKKRLPSTRKPQVSSDPDIQLALALSMSLNEVEQMEVLDEAIALAAESDDKILEMSSAQRKSTLQSFGFSTNKPAIEAKLDKPRRRKHHGPTVLQSRSQEMREQILTEKIAEVLVGSDSITQEKLKPVMREIRKFNGEIQSEELKKWHNLSADLWSRSIFCETDLHYYVEELKEFITPLRVNSDICTEIQEISEDSNDTRNEEDNQKDKSKIGGNFSNKTVSNEEINEWIDNSEEIQEDKGKIGGNFSNKIIPKEEINKSVDNSDGIICLSNDWSKMVGNSFLSDVSIFVKDTSFIHAHNLIFWTRCHSLTNDYQLCDDSKTDNTCYPIKYKIHWPNIDKSVALIFLKYVYCGQISPNVLNDKNIMNQIKFLGEKYKITKLVNYVDESSNRIDDCVDKSNNQSINNEEEMKEEVEKEPMSDQFNTSPDLFDDTEIMDISQNLINVSSTNSSQETVVLSDSKIENKQKSDLSRFIDKIQRQQARDILESDTDGETPVKNLQNRRKNPFKIGARDDDDSDPWIRRKSEENDVSISVENDKRTPLSLLEDEIRAHACENNPIIIQKEDHDVNTSVISRNHESQNESLDESMYTKYINEVKDNSIAEYRRALQYENITHRKHTSSRKNVITEDAEGNESSHSDKLSNIEDSHAANISEDLHFDTWEETSETADNDETSNGVKSIGKNDKNDGISKTSTHNLSDDEDFLENNPPIVVSSDEEMGFLPHDMDVFSQVLSPPATNRNLNYFHESLHNNKFDELSTSPSRLNDNLPKTPLKDSSQLTNPIASRRNIITEDADGNESSHSDKLSNIEDSHAANISEDLHFDTWEETSETADNEGTSNGVKSIRKNDKNDGVSKTSTDNLSDDDDFLENNPPIVVSSDEEMEFLPHDMGVFSQVVSPLASPKETTNQNLEYFHVSLHENKFDQLSPSPTRLNVNVLKTPLKDSSQLMNRILSTPENRLKRTRTPSSLHISYSVTPPLNYNGMKSPELNEQLNKYGLKPQKRPRAIQLLDHIYNELHPLVPVDSLPPETPNLTDDENEEPVCKKRQLNKYISSQEDDDDDESPIMPEEMDFYESEDDLNSQNATSVRQVFDRLLKNDKQLHIKVLGYEPLPLEWLCEKLKSEGFNGKINDVVSFLDDESITFQVQQPQRIKKCTKNRITKPNNSKTNSQVNFISK